jgi:hypothetical protein
MTDFDGDPLPAGHMDLVEPFDELRKKKRGESPWWEQEVPKSKYLSQAMPKQPIRQSSSLAKPRYHWQDFDNEAFSVLEERGIPNSRVEPTWTQAALERLMIDWCESNWGVAPSESQIRKHVGDVISRFKLQRGSPA